MRQRTIEILIEAYAWLLFIVLMFVPTIIDNERKSVIFLFSIWLPLSAIYLILHYTLGEGSKRASVKFKDTYKYSFKYKDFNELLEDANNKLTTEGYSIKTC